MDETDYRLCQLLMLDPRMQYRDLAERLGLSTQAAYRRFQGLIEGGVLAGFTADISLDYLHAIRVCVWGRSKSQTMENVVQTLCANDSTLEIFIGSGNFIYVIGLLKNVNDLESFVKHVKRAGEIQDAQVGLEGYGLISGLKVTRGGISHGKLTALDLKIINVLHKDARKSITEISGELSITIKTVKKRLSRLIDDGLIEFALDWRTGEDGGLFSLMLIELKDEASKEEVGWKIVGSGHKYVILGTFSNIPNIIVLMGWAKSIQEMGRLSDVMGKEEGILSIMPHILTQRYRSHDTWRDKLLVAETLQTRKT